MINRQCNYALIFVVAGLLVASACGGATEEPMPTTTPLPTALPTATAPPVAVAATPTTSPADAFPSPQKIMEGARAAFMAAGALHFQMGAEIIVPVEGDATSVLIGLEGDIQPPDGLQGQLVVSFGFFAVPMDKIMLGDASYTTNVITKEWELSYGLSAAFPTPLDFLGQAIAAVDDVLVVGVETGEDGRQLYHLRVIALSEALGGADAGARADLWYSVDDLLLQKVTADGQITLEAEGGPLERRLDFTGTASLSLNIAIARSDVPVVIEAPQIGDVQSTPGVRTEDRGGAHIAPGDSFPPYATVPATSGPHYDRPLAPAPWGVHDEVLLDEVLVHNLEHGGIGVHHNCPAGCEDLVARLAEIVTAAVDRGEKVIMSPYPGMSATIALTAWTFIDLFLEFDEERVLDFIGAHESSPIAPEYQVP